jgi:YD repeat-containing protein
MPVNPYEQAFVYYISDATCTDPHQHGYFGISKNETREAAHRYSRRFPPDVTFTIVFRGIRRECAAVEAHYRPQPRIGWNRARGGGKWRGEKAINAIIAAALMPLLILPTAALAQSRTYYDAGGRVIGRSATDSQRSTTYYDAGGRVSARASSSGNTTTIYDAAGRRTGTISK